MPRLCSLCQPLFSLQDSVLSAAAKCALFSVLSPRWPQVSLDAAVSPAQALVEAGALGRDSALRKAAETGKGSVGIVCYEDETGDVARMTREALAADKVGLTSDALERFVGRLPRERGLMRQEIERLALYIGPGSGRSIDVEELDAHLGVEPDASLQDAALQAFGGRPAPSQATTWPPPRATSCHGWRARPRVPSRGLWRQLLRAVCWATPTSATRFA